MIPPTLEDVKVKRMEMEMKMVEKVNAVTLIMRFHCTRCRWVVVSYRILTFRNVSLPLRGRFLFDIFPTKVLLNRWDFNGQADFITKLFSIGPHKKSFHSTRCNWKTKSDWMFIYEKNKQMNAREFADAYDFRYRIESYYRFARCLPIKPRMRFFVWLSPS